MRRIAAVVAAVVLSASACGTSSSTDRTIRVDFRQDEFASHYWRFFPGTIDAHPGDTIVFDQQWTGEPHTVTLGTLVDGALPRIEALERKYANVDEDSPPELAERAEREFGEASKGLPTFDPYQDAGAQGWLQPCYLRDGMPPTDANTPCAMREQPRFDGRQSYYSSGFIAPTGPTGNIYRVPLADDISPGMHRFYCIVHFPDMQGTIEVKPKSAQLQAPGAVNATARDEIEELAGPLRRAFVDAKAGRARGPNDERVGLPLGGYHAADEYTVALDEFVPKTVTARVGEPVTWSIVGAHTVSFDVPRFVPIYRVREDGSVERNPVVDRAAGGSPDPPAVDFVKGPVTIDGGTWDGSGFISSGLLGSEPYAQYTLRFSKAGRYKFACLVHPPMVGTLIVRS